MKFKEKKQKQNLVTDNVLIYIGQVVVTSSAPHSQASSASSTHKRDMTPSCLSLRKQNNSPSSTSTTTTSPPSISPEHTLPGTASSPNGRAALTRPCTTTNSH